MTNIKNRLLRFVNSNQHVRRTAKMMVRGYWKLQYMIIRMFSKTDEKLCVFEAYQGRKYSCSPRAIYEEMLKKEAQQGYRFIWVFREPKQYQWLLEYPGTSIVKLGTLEYYKAFAKAKYWIVNSRTRHCLVPGRDQCFLQTWHGTFFKRCGCDINTDGHNLISQSEMKNDYRKEGKRVSYFLSPSKYYSEIVQSAFGLEPDTDKTIELGYPRNDRLFERSEQEILEMKKRIGIPIDKKVILYAPTFRDNEHTKDGCSFTLGFNLEHFVKEFGTEYVMLFRTHYFVTEQIDLLPYQNVIYDVNSWDDINELYLVSDLLITDYSSVFYDYANLKKPILFFVYDMEAFKHNIRDFYLDFSELPGEIIKTEKDLFESIRNQESGFEYDEKYKKFHERFNYLDGPDTSRKVIDWMLGNAK